MGHWRAGFIVSDEHGCHVGSDDEAPEPKDPESGRPIQGSFMEEMLSSHLFVDMPVCLKLAWRNKSDELSSSGALERT